MSLKQSNEYAQLYPDYADTPKAVIAAVAFSLAMRLSNEDEQEAMYLLADEWKALYEIGIVPQKPKAKDAAQ